MSKRIWAVLAAGLFALSLEASASAASPTNLDTELGKATGQDGRACVLSSRIRGYGVVNSKTVNISTTGKEYYVATLLYSCPSLETNVRAGFESRFSELCGRRGDNLFSARERCVVNGLYKFEDRKAAFAAVDAAKEAARTKAGPDKTDGDK